MFEPVKKALPKMLGDYAASAEQIKVPEEKAT